MDAHRNSATAGVGKMLDAEVMTDARRDDGISHAGRTHKSVLRGRSGREGMLTESLCVDGSAGLPVLSVKTGGDTRTASSLGAGEVGEDLSAEAIDPVGARRGDINRRKLLG